jgi:hypothetical protein
MSLLKRLSALEAHTTRYNYPKVIFLTSLKEDDVPFSGYIATWQDQSYVADVMDKHLALTMINTWVDQNLPKDEVKLIQLDHCDENTARGDL